MAVTKKIVEDIRWPDDVEFDENDAFLAIVIRENPREHKMDSVDIQRDVVMLGYDFETIDEVADELLNRLRNGVVDFDPGWARIVKSDGVVTFGTDTFDPQ